MKNSFIYLIFVFLILNAFDSYGQAIDPHRGLTVIRFLNFTPASINAGYPVVDSSVSILGTIREDSLLLYCRDNHITYLELYDVRFSDTMIQELFCRMVSG